MDVNISLPGVVLLSDIVVGGGVQLKTANVIDEGSDISALYVVGLPFIFFWIAGVAFVSYNTDDDGYLVGIRRVESRNPRLRLFQSVLVFVIESMQMMACLFTPATVRHLPSTALIEPARVWLWYGAFNVTFPVCVTFDLLWTVFFVIPMVLYYTLKRETFNRIQKTFTTGTFGLLFSFFQDCFTLWLPLPIFVQLLRPIPCTYFLDKTPATALEGTVLCASTDHLNYAITGGVVFLVTFCVGVSAGSVPSLVARYGDTALNGRFMSLSFALKAMMAVVYTVAGERHEFYLLGSMFVLQFLMLFLSMNLRPNLVERVNYHRSGAYACAIMLTIMCIVAAGLADPLTPLPFVAGFLGLGFAAALLVCKYYFMTCGKLFPEISVNYVDGTKPSYEGDLCLGRNIPHGHGRLRWEDKVFTGYFRFGKEDGYGVLTLGKYFYEGNFKAGVRQGFGMTNMLFVLEKHDFDDRYSLHEDPGAESYEGFWISNVHEGSGTKKFRDGDRFDGNFENGNENGMGTWTMQTALGPYTLEGEWEDGIFVAGLIDPNEQEYEGDLRYGVPHGTGCMRIGDDIFEGEWRAGKMHGFGIVKMQEGEYEGHFFEGLYSDEGKWSDEHGVYVGKFKEGLKHGHGVEETPDGTFEGHFERGYRHGYGTFRYNEREFYQGSWRKNEYHGSGLLVTEDFEYDGQWIDGRKEGPRGHIKFANGVEFVGGWVNDRFCDQGRLRIPGLGEFQGRFVDGNKVGQGRFTFFDGSEYVGDWDYDLAQGEGKLTFATRAAIILLASMNPEDMDVEAERSFLDGGGEYRGRFEGGEFCGEGTVTCSDGSRYTGEWEGSVPHGTGVLVMASGGTYTGEWVDGRKEGVGEMHYPDRRRYEGGWVNDKRHGHGILRGPKGDVLHDCEWVNDAPISAAVVREVALDDIPMVDVDELLRAIMPNTSSPMEVEESRMRKRIDLEEACLRFRMIPCLEEALAFTRTARAAFMQRHALIRAALQREQHEEFVALQKPALARVLNLWKAQFRNENGRDPKKSDMVRSTEIGPVYKRYMDLTKE